MNSDYDCGLIYWSERIKMYDNNFTSNDCARSYTLE